MHSKYKLRSSTFLRQNAVFFLGSLAVGFLNYLYYPVLGRLLPPDNFGEVQVLASLLAQIAIFLNVFGLLTVTITANDENVPRRNRLIMELEKLAVGLSGLLLLGSGIGCIALQRFFHFSSPAPFIILMCAVAATVPLTFRSAYLRGRQQFAAAAWISIVGSAADLVFAALLVWFGLATTGAMLGLVAGQFAAFLLAAAYARRHGFTESLRGALLRTPDIRLLLPELRYAGTVLVCSLGITLLYSADTVVVKHYFDARTAGLYAGIATIARIVFFLTAPVVQVLLPSVRLAQPAGHNRRVLGKSLMLLVAIGGAAVFGFTFLPQLIIRVLMGSTYIAYAGLLPRLSLLIFVVSLLNLFIMYHLSLRRAWTLPAVLVGLVIAAALLYFRHDSLQAVISSLLYGSLTMLAIIGGWVGLMALKLSGSKEEVWRDSLSQ